MIRELYFMNGGAASSGAERMRGEWGTGDRFLAVRWGLCRLDPKNILAIRGQAFIHRK